jgi:hypothetical protein
VHGLVILMSLQMIRKNNGRAKIKGNRVFIPLIILIGIVSKIPAASLMDTFTDNFGWYGIVTGTMNITIISSLFYCMWIVAGVYRAMRSELQFSDAPVWWLVFMISSFFMHYGYVATVDSISFAAGVAIAMFFTFAEFSLILYFLALSEPKDIMNFRLLETSWKSGDKKTFFQNLPLWLTTLPMVFIFGLLAVIFLNMALKGTVVEEIYRKLWMEGQGRSFLLLIAIFGFIIRDLGILLLLNFSNRSNRADSALLIYLLLLYVLLPFLTRGNGIGAAFYPGITENSLVLVAFPVIEAAVVLFFLQRRWKQIRLAA